jgi:alkylated DNA repair dioxygenase AlkB
MKLQFDLFDGPQEQPEILPNVLEGFHYRTEFITETEEDALLKHLRDLPFQEFDFHGYLGKRRVVSFGWQYDYSGRQLKKADAIPDFLFGVRKRAAALAELEPEQFQQVLVTEYRPGSGIGWHRDKAVFGRVVGISLLAPCVLRFRRRIGASTTRVKRKEDRVKVKREWERMNVGIEPRSAYLLSGPARFEWEHSILRVDSLRYAITFRNVLEPQVK